MTQGTTVVARWPFTPLGVRVTLHTPDTYELGGVGYVVNECVAELRKETLTSRIIRKLLRK